MGKYIIKIFVIAVVALLTGCDSNPKNAKSAQNKAEVHSEDDGHDHSKDGDKGHSEDDGHDHSKDGKEAHSEDDGHGHGVAEETKKEEHTDEIIFTKAQADIAGMEIYTVEPGAFSSVIKTSGQIATAQGYEATIVATSNGIVAFANQSVSVGASIKAGATIVNISAKNLLAGDPIVKMRIAYETAQKEYNRAENLIKDKIISAKEFEQVRSRYETAKTSYEAQSADVTTEGIRIKSPISGYISSILVNNGDYVALGQVIAIVSQNKRLQLIADVAESKFGDLKSITNANFITPYNNKVYKLSDLNGRLLSFGRSSNKTSFYIPITFEFNNIGDIIPGSFVEVYLLSAPQNNVISIPISALTEEQGLYFVYLQIGKEEFKKVEVRLGDSNGEKFSVLSGLKRGDKVVSKGAYQVKLAANSSVIPEGHSH